MDRVCAGRKESMFTVSTGSNFSTSGCYICSITCAPANHTTDPLHVCFHNKTLTRAAVTLVTRPWLEAHGSGLKRNIFFKSAKLINELTCRTMFLWSSNIMTNELTWFTPHDFEAGDAVPNAPLVYSAQTN